MFRGLGVWGGGFRVPCGFRVPSSCSIKGSFQGSRASYLGGLGFEGLGFKVPF